MDDYGQVRSPQHIWLGGALGHCTKEQIRSLQSKYILNILVNKASDLFMNSDSLCSYEAVHAPALVKLPRFLNDIT